RVNGETAHLKESPMWLRTLLILSLMAAACITQAQAADPLQSKGKPPESERALSDVDDQKHSLTNTTRRCVAEVRHELKNNQFDAFVDGMNVKYFGTKEEEFKFMKCMRKYGVSLGPNLEKQ